MWKRTFKGYFKFTLGLQIVVIAVLSIVLGTLTDNFFLTLLAMVIGTILTLIEFSFLGTIIEMAFHLEAIEYHAKNIDRNTSVSSDGEIIHAVMHDDDHVQRSVTIKRKNDKWTCPKCHRSLYGYQTTCICGMSKEEALGGMTSSAESTNKTETNQSWKCKRCGTINTAYTYLCRCGMKKSENNGEEIDASLEERLNLQEAKDREEKEKQQMGQKMETQNKVSQQTMPVNLDAYGNPYYYDEYGRPYYIAPDGNAYYYS